MALTILDPGIFDVIVPWNWFYSTSPFAGSSVDDVDISKLTDFADKNPTFDTQHEIFTNPIVDAASQNWIADNSNGLEDPLHSEPTLTYTHTDGYSTTHETSKGLTIGVTQAFTYDFAGEGGSTTLSATGSFDWTDGSSVDHTKSVGGGGGAPFDTPSFKIYEQKLTFEQQQVQVPYTLIIHVDGNIGFTWNNPQGYRDLTVDTGTVFHNVGFVGQGPGGNAGPIPAYKDVNWTDFTGNFGGSGAYLLHGSLTVEGAGNVRTKVYDITNGGSQEVQAEYDAAVPIGIHRTMDDAGRLFVDTPFDDWVDGGNGNDRIRLNGGEDIAHAGGGDDRIIAIGVGRSLLDGGDGNDVIRLTSTAAYGTVLGGAGNDRIHVDAPAAMLYGGAGNDRYWLNGATTGGTVITDTEGHNRLWIDNGGLTLGFERVSHGDSLYILLGGGDTYDRARDVVWVNFFANPYNRIDGLRTAEVEDLTITFVPPIPPAELTPTIPEFINAANWAYSRDTGNFPADLRPFEANGQHLALEVTPDGFYGAAFLTPLNQVIVAFEGTHLSAFSTDPVFVAAQVAADGQIYLGEAPAAYADALAFTQSVLAAAAARGIMAEDVFVTGHSLGAAEAMVVAAQLDLAGTTFAAPGIPAASIPAGQASKLLNYVEYGDPLGNYSANPNRLGGFLYSDDILRFGDATYLGDPLAGLALEAAGALFGPGTTPAENATGLGLLASLVAKYHVLTAYAADLGVTLGDPGALGDVTGVLAALSGGVPDERLIA